MKIYFADDDNLEKAGLGLGAAPFVDEILGQGSEAMWMMSPSEQAAMLFLLQNSRPKIAIEIGTRFGGSLQAISRYSEKVYALDIDPEVPRRLAGKHSNVEFVIGSSTETLPPLLEKLEREGGEIGFVLVDGDHSTEGVRRDMENLLKVRPKGRMLIIMHDSFNSECRQGLMAAPWAQNEYVQAVELDFVSGTVNPAPAFRGQHWGGLALAVLEPHKREGRFEVTGRARLTLEKLAYESLVVKLKRFIKRRLLGRK